jgi:hypothetical protein
MAQRLSIYNVGCGASGPRPAIRHRGLLLLRITNVEFGDDVVRHPDAFGQAPFPAQFDTMKLDGTLTASTAILPASLAFIQYT